MCVYVCVWVCVNVYMDMYVYVYMCVFVHVCINHVLCAQALILAFGTHQWGGKKVEKPSWRVVKWMDTGIRVGFRGKVTLQQSLGGDEGVSHRDMWGKNTPSEQIAPILKA